MDGREVVRDCQLYSDSVAFFYVLYSQLSEAGLSVEVEADRNTPRGIKRPDFLISKSGRLTDVLEHKASLSDPAHTLAEFNPLPIS
jgi:hypothetical protein